MLSFIYLYFSLVNCLDLTGTNTKKLTIKNNNIVLQDFEYHTITLVSDIIDDDYDNL